MHPCVALSLSVAGLALITQAAPHTVDGISDVGTIEPLGFQQVAQVKTPDTRSPDIEAGSDRKSQLDTRSTARMPRAR